MLYLPLATTPLGWLILGVGGYTIYKAGKKKGMDEAVAAGITDPPELKAEESKTKESKGEK